MNECARETSSIDPVLPTAGHAAPVFQAAISSRWDWCSSLLSRPPRCSAFSLRPPGGARYTSGVRSQPSSAHHPPEALLSLRETAKSSLWPTSSCTICHQLLWSPPTPYYPLLLPPSAPAPECLCSQLPPQGLCMTFLPCLPLTPASLPPSSNAGPLATLQFLQAHTCLQLLYILAPNSSR